MRPATEGGGLPAPVFWSDQGHLQGTIPAPPAWGQPCQSAIQPCWASLPFLEAPFTWAAADDLHVWGFPPKFPLLSHTLLFISLPGSFHGCSFELC